MNSNRKVIIYDRPTPIIYRIKVGHNELFSDTKRPKRDAIALAMAKHLIAEGFVIPTEILSPDSDDKTFIFSIFAHKKMIDLP